MLHAVNGKIPYAERWELGEFEQDTQDVLAPELDDETIARVEQKVAEE